MKITALAAKPKLTPITLGDPEIVAKYGEPVEFWTWDRQPLSVFMKLTTVGDNTSEVINVVKDLILDEEGKPIITDGITLPTDILMAGVARITEVLGK